MSDPTKEVEPSMERALFRIAQGVVDPAGAARRTLEALSLPTPAPDSEPSADAPDLSAEIERLRAMLWVRVLCGRCGRYYRYNRADDPGGEKASDEHGIGHGDGSPALPAAPVPATERETSDEQ